MRRVLARPAAGALAAVAAYLVLMRGRQLRWGATADEAVRSLPGDDLVDRADLVATRAITVRAPVEAVWPWLAQMGQGRGGLYSYDALENIVGCEMHSADEVVADWQEVTVGDAFRLHPDVALRVAAVDPPRALVVEGGISAAGTTTATGDPGAPFDFTWAFVLVPDRADRSRLLVRERYRWHSVAARLMVESASVVSFVMTERMLRGIRDRAEGRSRRVRSGRTGDA